MLQQAQEISGKGPTELATLETLHIVHILEQTVRGYLTGTNCNRWTSHVFNYNHSRTQSNVTNLFYRLEFQGKGTPPCSLACLAQESLYHADKSNKSRCSMGKCRFGF